jgi:cellulose biosynthesis protein BcsQ
MPVHISSFIARGGAGKTTSTLHLAGALHLLKYSVALVDADMPQCTLSHMSSDGHFYIHPARANRNNKSFQVFTADTAQDKLKQMEQEPDFIITDCTPRLTTNDFSSQSIEKSDICLIPFALTPMGIGKGGEHIISTLKLVRSISNRTKIVLLPNQYPSNLNANNNACLLQVKAIVRVTNEKDIDRNIFFNPDKLHIRQSQSLANFGQEPLLFNAQSHLPYDDFTNLAQSITQAVTA